jgi:CheY-like chemotaxis protein
MMSRAFCVAVQTNLGRHDYRVETAASGGAALEAYTRLRPDFP